MTHPKSTDLLPCPFCGGEALFIADDSYGGCGVGCSKPCEAEPYCGAGKVQPEKAISAWNTRISHASVAREDVARIIDPNAWYHHSQGRVAFGNGDELEFSLAKADAILALLPASPAQDEKREIEILRRALAWHGDPQRMATTREDWQQTIDAAIAWVKSHPEDGYASFSSFAASPAQAVTPTPASNFSADAEPNDAGPRADASSVLASIDPDEIGKLIDESAWDEDTLMSDDDRNDRQNEAAETAETILAFIKDKLK